MTPKKLGSEWFVTSGVEQIAGPFKTNADAWRWIDRHQGDPINRSEKTTDYLVDLMTKE